MDGYIIALESQMGQSKQSPKFIYIFMDNVPFATAGLIYGLQREARQHKVKVFFPSHCSSSRLGIDSDNALENCFPIDYKKGFEAFVKEEREHLQDAVFVSFGYLFSSFVWASRLKTAFGGKLIVVSERPTCVGRFPKLKLPLILLKHRRERFKKEKQVDALLAMGEIGVSSFCRLGWPKDKVFDFCYCPLIDTSSLERASFDRQQESNRTFVYSGRLTYRSKGPNRLISYFKKNPSDQLLVIGDYGDDRDRFLRDIGKLPNVHCLGTKSLGETVSVMAAADCVLVPSVVDGWNVNVNLAVFAKTPIVITNKCASDEVVSRHKNGVVSKNSRKAFTKAISCFVSDMQTIKRNAENIGACLAPREVASYFLQIVNFIDGGEYAKNHPVAPWIR